MRFLKSITSTGLILLMASLFLVACSGGHNSGGSTVSIEGAGVKGPLAGAVVRVYQVDLAAADLKGTQLDEGSSNDQAAIVGLDIDDNLSGLLLIEFVADANTIDIGTGLASVIDRLTTVVDVQRIYNGDAIYATPLTSMAVSIAQANADKGAPYAGDSSDTISTAEFTAALAVAQNQVKSTLGFGLDSSIDIFTVPPILTADTTTAEEQAQVVKYRAAIEAIAALTDQVASDSSAADTPQEIFDGLIEDLKDGTIDGLNDTTPVATLAALDTPIDTTLGNLDPATLVIPNTTTPITDIKQTLSDELATTGESVDTTPLAVIDVNLAPPVLVAESNDTYAIGGTVSGLSGTVVLQNNAGDDLTLSANASFAFATPVAEGNAYNVTVLTQPAGQTCSTSANSGTVNGSNITAIVVSCSTNTYTVGGNVSGLTGSVVLQNNGSDDLTITADGAFTFNTSVAYGSAYSVSVLTQPAGQTCVASSNSGSVSEVNVTDVTITCTTNTYTIGGSVTGLTGSVVLQNNGGDDLTLNADTNFTFFTAVAYGSAYNVSVLTQPTGQTCTASSNTGTVGASNVNDVLLYCTTNPVLSARPGPASATLSWDDTGATSYDLYYATAPDCDIVNYASCDGGTMVPNVTSPYTVSSLTNGQNYWFKLESVAAGGNGGSNEVGTRPDQLIPNGEVDAIVHDATSGVTYLGGAFTKVGLATGNGVPLSMTTGHPTAFPHIGRSGGLSYVNVAVSDGAGGYYIGGYFDTVGGQTRDNLAHILADGTLGPWNPSASYIVSSMAVSGSTVYVGGQFTSITDSNGTQTRKYLAAIDATTGTVTSWNPDASQYVFALAVSGNMVYAGGAFTSFGGGAYSRNYLAAFDTSSATPSVPTSWDPNANIAVFALAVSGNTVYAGGFFTSFGGGTYSRSRIAAFDTSSATPSIPTDWNPSANNGVTALAVSGSTVYAGGYFTAVTGTGGGTSGSYLTAIDAASGQLTTWNPIVNKRVDTLTVSGSTVYVGGQFTSIDDGNGAQARNYLAAIGTDGTLESWNPSAGDRVITLAVSGNTVYAGGEFSSMGNESRNKLAAINTDGSLSTTWQPTADGVVRALALSSNTVYAGGEFTNIDDGSGAQGRNRLAAIDADGNLTSWDPGADNVVRALATYNGTVFVGGDFTAIGVGQPSHTYLAALDASGNLTNWSPYAYSHVNALAVSGTGTVYVGGRFITITDTNGTSSRVCLAAFDATNGIVDPNWNPRTNYEVRAIAVSDSTGTVYVGGDFTNADDNQGTVLPSKYLAAIGTDGKLDTTWTPNADAAVYALALSGSRVYAGGKFNTIDDGNGAQGRNYLAAIGTDGSLDAWDPTANGFVNALTVSGSTLYVGGKFYYIDGESRASFSAMEP